MLDRGSKFAHYRRLASFREYLLVTQTELRVEHYLRQDEGRWLLVEYREPEDQIELESLECRLRLADIYERIALPASPDSAVSDAEMLVGKQLRL